MPPKRIFISHSHRDVQTAQAIAAALDEAGFQPWIDLREIQPGDSFIGGMNSGLEDASYLLLLISKDSVASRWVTKEWTAALASQAIVVVPIRLDDTPPPALLSDIVYIDLRHRLSDGLKEIVQFFERETGEVGQRLRTHEFSLRQASRRQLRLVAMACIDDVGLNSFCFDANLDPRALAGSSLHEKLVSLMHTTALEGKLEGFAEWLEAEKARCVKQQIKQLETTSAWNWKTEQ